MLRAVRCMSAARLNIVLLICAVMRERIGVQGSGFREHGSWGLGKANILAGFFWGSWLEALSNFSAVFVVRAGEGFHSRVYTKGNPKPPNKKHAKCLPSGLKRGLSTLIHPGPRSFRCRRASEVTTTMSSSDDRRSWRGPMCCRAIVGASPRGWVKSLASTPQKIPVGRANPDVRSRRP